MDYYKIGQKIRKIRKAHRLSQEELAEKVGVSKSAIAKWETDGGLPDRDNLRRIADIMNVSVGDLHRVIEGGEIGKNEMSINITQDVIAVLESYGYKVIPPDKQIKQ
jgi:transcriptional regulator with XRE-family HTH domain